MNFCFVSTLEIDSICVTFDFMAIQRGLECPKSILFVGITTFFQIALPQFLRYLHVSYMKKIPFSIPTICNKPHVDILKNAPLRVCWKRVINETHPVFLLQLQSRGRRHKNDRFVLSLSTFKPLTLLLSPHFCSF